MEQVEVDGLRIAYERAGSGPPVVLLHGFVGDARATWGHQIDALSDEYTVVAWDAPGVGRSSDPPGSFRAPEYADCLVRFIEVLGWSRAHVGGMSFGGVLALELVRRHPSVVRSLVLCGAYAGWAGSLSPAVVADRLRLCLELAGRPVDGLVDALAPTMFSTTAPAERVAAFTEALRRTRPAGFRTMALASAETDLRDVLGRIDVPTLLLHGEADERAPLAVAAQLHAGIAASRLVVLPGVGHVSSVEAAEAVTREMRAFLHQVGR